MPAIWAERLCVLKPKSDHEKEVNSTDATRFASFHAVVFTVLFCFFLFGFHLEPDFVAGEGRETA